MTILSFHRTVYLKCAYPKHQILTGFAASSALNYLQIVGLKIHPKFNCILPYDMERMEQLCFPGKKPIRVGWRNYYESKLPYAVGPKHRKSSESKCLDLPTESDIHRDAFNARMSLKGHETVVAFYATDENIFELAARLDQKLSPGLSFFNIVKNAAPLTDVVIQQQNRAAKL